MRIYTAKLSYLVVSYSTIIISYKTITTASNTYHPLHMTRGYTSCALHWVVATLLLIWTIHSFFTGMELRNFVIEILQPNPPTVCATVTTAIEKGATQFIGCSRRMEGSIVRIRMLGTQPRVLSLCEVQVFGTRRELPLTHLYVLPWDNLLCKHCKPLGFTAANRIPVIFLTARLVHRGGSPCPRKLPRYVCLESPLT